MTHLGRVASLRLVFLFAAVLASRARAQLTPVPVEIDLGRLHQNVSVTREVKLTNTGKQPLRITRVLTDCACTAAEPESYDVAAGATTKLKITAESRTYQGETQQTVHVRTNRGEAVITLKMTVAPYGDWDVDPSPLVLNPSKKSDESTGEITVHYLGVVPPKITAFKSDSDWLTASVAPGPDNHTLVVTAKKSPAAPVGNPTALLDLVTNDTTQPTLRVAVVALVTPTVKVTPNLISLPAVKPGETTRAAFRIVAWEGTEPPTVLTPFGEVHATGREGADYLFELVVTPQEAGTTTRRFQVCLGNIVQLEVPFVVRAAK